MKMFVESVFFIYSTLPFDNWRVSSVLAWSGLPLTNMSQVKRVNFSGNLLGHAAFKALKSSMKNIGELVLTQYKVTCDNFVETGKATNKGNLKPNVHLDSKVSIGWFRLLIFLCIHTLLFWVPWYWYGIAQVFLALRLERQIRSFMQFIWYSRCDFNL